MANLTKIGLGIAALIAVLIQLPMTRNVWTLLKLGLAVGKVLQPLSDFTSYECRRLHDPLLEACEDMWLSEPTRQLFLACSDLDARTRWLPNEAKFDLAGRSTRDAIIVMDLETLDFKSTSMPDFPGTKGDGIINFAGFTGVDLEDGIVEFFITNFRPSVDRKGQVVPVQASVGCNATIEVFRLPPNTDRLQHVRTVADPAIATPNRVTVADRHGFYLTNDHGQHRKGWRALLSPLLLTGDVTFCPDQPSAPCRIVSEGYGYPNGLIRSRVDGLLYVPESAQGGITVLRPTSDDSLEIVNEIDLPYAIDNLSEDQDGNLWAAIIPKGIEIMKQSNDPHHYFPSSSVFKISREQGGKFLTEKVLEDSAGSVLPGTTTVVHDAKTGRLFLGGKLTVALPPTRSLPRPKQTATQRRPSAILAKLGSASFPKLDQVSPRTLESTQRWLQAENASFVRSMQLPAEIRQMVWSEVWSHRKPEVWPYFDSCRPTDGLAAISPPQLLVEIDLVLMHACHDSRAFLTSAAGGVRFLYSFGAKHNVPCRAFDPALDTLYLGWHNWDEAFWKNKHLGRHCGRDSATLDALRDNKYTECWQRVENIALQLDAIKANGGRYAGGFSTYSAGILAIFPRLKSVSIVVKSHVPLDSHLYSGQVYVPEHRCRLVEAAEDLVYSGRHPAHQWIYELWDFLEFLRHPDQAIATHIQTFEIYVARRGHTQWEKYPRRV